MLNEGSWGTNKFIVSCNTTNFTGTDKNVTYKFETLNNKLIKIHGTGGNIDATF